VTPIEFIEKYTADGVRYWASNARLGTDTAFDETMLKIGKRLVTKLFNAGKFVLSHDAEVMPVTEELDRAFALKLRRLVEQSTAMMEKFDFASALSEIEKFFWQNFTDNYIELAKNRAKGLEESTKAAQSSAIAGLRLGLNVLLRLFAPILPYITEEIWSWVFASETGWESIHTAPWPDENDFGDVMPPKNLESFDVAVACVSELRKYKTEREISIVRDLPHCTIAGHPASLEKLQLVIDDVMTAAHINNYTLKEDSGLEEYQFAVLDAEVV
jgi:valyl-tRNA synthetase